MTATPTNYKAKLCFVISLTCIVTSVYFFATRPALMLYLFTVVFVFSMILRVINYWHSNYLLFLLDMCYFINTLSLILVWALPTSTPLLRIQFGLANAHVYCGAFLYRNALVFSDLQKLVSTFIHILPVVFSFLLRWFPRETSVWWYRNFVNTGATPDLLLFTTDHDWFYSMFIPLLIFTTREVLYYIIVYGFVKPDEKYLDSFRYMHKKKLFAQLFWDRFPPRWHLIVWILFGIIASAVVLCVAMIAWSSYMFHSAMLVIQLVTITWNGACYYIDYYPIDWHRRYRLQTLGTTFLSSEQSAKPSNEDASLIPINIDQDDGPSSINLGTADATTSSIPVFLPVES